VISKGIVFGVGSATIVLLAALTLSEDERTFSNRELVPNVIRDQSGLRLGEASAPSVDPTISTAAAATQAFVKPIERFRC
jgi:K+-transporting ATPase c subunit